MSAPNKLVRAVQYARYSSDKQRGESIDAQIRAMDEYCRRKGYTVVRRYADEAKSGKYVMNRVEYTKMLRDVAKDDFDIIIFHKIDRNARNQLDYYTTKDMLLRSGCRYEYAAEHIDSTPGGQMMEGYLVTNAATYSLNLAEETKKGQKENALKGKFNGGTPPLGYRIKKDKDNPKKGGYYVIDKAEAPIVRLIFARYAEGASYVEIIEELNKLGYRTKRGQNFGKNSLHDMLRNQKYIGTYAYGRTLRSYGGSRNSHPREMDHITVTEDIVPAIIDKALFEQVQQRLNLRINKGIKNSKENIYLLSGLLKCGLCGASMVAHKHKAHGYEYVYYGCGTKERKGKAACELKAINGPALENKLIDEIADRIFGRASRNIIKKHLEQEQKEYAKSVTDVADIIKSLNQQKSALEIKLGNLYNLAENGAMDEFDNKRMHDIKNEIRSVDSQIVAAEQVPKNKPLKFDDVMDMLSVYKDVIKQKKDTQELRAFLTTFVRSIIVYADKVDVELLIDFVSFVVPRTRHLPYRQICITLSVPRPTAEKAYREIIS